MQKFSPSRILYWKKQLENKKPPEEQVPPSTPEYK
jgi:hypothetical protein